MIKVLRAIVVISVVIFLGACGGSGTSSTASTAAAGSSAKSGAPGVAQASGSSAKSPSSTNRKGKLIYKQYCVICHGADGTLGVSDATDLSKSNVSMEERIDQITNGKGLMTPYKDILSEEQIKAVADYLDELKK